MNLSSAKLRPFRLGLNKLNLRFVVCAFVIRGNRHGSIYRLNSILYYIRQSSEKLDIAHTSTECMHVQSTEVCNIFNEYFIKAASNIGNEDPILKNESVDDILSCYNDDDTIKRITNNSHYVGVFNCSSGTVQEVKKLLENMDKKKATGYDNIPPKILKVAAHELAFPITNLINLSVEASCIPSNLKKNQNCPLFLKLRTAFC